MDKVLLTIVVLETIALGVLGWILIRMQLQMRRFTRHAEQIKKRRIDLEDLELKNTASSSQVIMADAINAIKNNMQTFLETTKGNVVVLSDAIDVITNGAERNQDGSQRIADSLGIIAEKVEEQLHLVGSCLDLIEENTERLMEIDGSVKKIGLRLNETAQNCKTGVDSIECCEKNMDSVSQNLNRSEKILYDFSKKIGEINEISSFIVEISESLNLLSLNASIEAARAGEAGKGFSVVAKEMGVMAEKTQEGIENINEILDNVIKSSAQVNTCIRESVKVFEQSNQQFDSVSASFRAIDRQSGEINEMMKDIFRKIDNITDNSKMTKTQAHQAYDASEQIVSGTQEIAQVSTQTADASAKMSENVESLDSMLNGLETLLKQYTTSVEPVKAPAGKKIKIGVFCILDNDFWYSVRRGAIYAKKELESLGAEVRFIPFRKWDDDEIKNMREKLDRMLEEGFDGFICPGFIAGAAERLLHARNIGKKVFVFNCDAPEAKWRDGVFQPDVSEAGTIAAKEMAKAINKNGRVVVLCGETSVAVNKIRCESFVNYLSGIKGIKVAETVFIDNTDEDAYAKAKAAIKKYPDLKGMYITTGTPLAAARAIADSRKKISLVVFDHSQEIFTYIKKGIISAAIGQDPFGQGHDPVVWMYNCLVTGKDLPEVNMKCRCNVVDRDNVDSLVEL